MINHNKKWMLYDNNLKFYERDFKNVLNSADFFEYDFFYKEIYALEYSATNCIYEMDKCVLESEDVVVDLGANVGFFTAYAASKCKRVIAVEGSPEIFSCLVRNTKNEYSNIDYLNANIVSDNNIKIGTWSDNPTRLNITIENIFKLYDLKTIDFLKVDIEGGEYDIFKYIDRNILSKIRKIAIEVHDPNKNDELIKSINKPFFYYFNYYLTFNLQQTFYFY